MRNILNNRPTAIPYSECEKSENGVSAKGKDSAK